jgi:hypothetical protein
MIETLAEHGTFGWIITDAKTGDTVSAHNPEEFFPLASAAKLAIGAVVAEAVRTHELSWGQLLQNVVFDPKENSDELYPYLKGRTEQELHDVAEVMIACHDHACATALAGLFGGWEALQTRVGALFPGIRIDQNPRDLERNGAPLNALMQLLQRVSNGFQQEPVIWKPLLAGLFRHPYKTEGIPEHQQYNLTGGLPTAALDLGMAGPLLYVIAGKQITNRAETDPVMSELLIHHFSQSI